MSVARAGWPLSTVAPIIPPQVLRPPPSCLASSALRVEQAVWLPAVVLHPKRFGTTRHPRAPRALAPAPSHDCAARPRRRAPILCSRERNRVHARKSRQRKRVRTGEGVAWRVGLHSAAAPVVKCGSRNTTPSRREGAAAVWLDVTISRALRAAARNAAAQRPVLRRDLLDSATPCAATYPNRHSSPARRACSCPSPPPCGADSG
jgi:hypothetical protein